MASVSAACSLAFGWLLGAPLALVMAVGLLYGFSALGGSPIYSTAITEVLANDWSLDRDRGRGRNGESDSEA
jgi:hypothetical protein